MAHYLIKELYTNMPAADLADVKINGWVRTSRESKTFAFVELNDGSYFRNLQVILEEEKLTPDTLLTSLKKLYDDRQDYIDAMNKSAQSSAIDIICGLIRSSAK